MWKPLITDPGRTKHIRKKISQITTDLSKDSGRKQYVSLFEGAAGLSIYYSYLNKFEKSDAYNDDVEDLIGTAFNHIDRGFGFPTFCSGIAGILWTSGHLAEQGFTEDDEFNEDVVAYLCEQMLVYARDGNFDYLHGADGIGLYLMKYYDKIDKKYFDELLSLKKKHGVMENNTICWETMTNMQANLRTFNLSLSHGISSFIVFLCMLLEKQPGYKEAEELINLSVNYLLSKKNPPSRGLQSIFPGYVTATESISESRLAWCYGDLGNAVALKYAGTVLKKQELLNEASEIITHASKRRGLPEQRVRDSGICHGAAGLAHMFNRFYQETGSESCKEAALYWLDETLKMDTFEDGLAGFKKLNNQEEFESSVNILDGVSGIGLVLISLISDIEPKWDRCLLLS